MPFGFSVLAVVASAALFSLIALRLKYGNDCSGGYQPRVVIVPAPELEAIVSEIAFSNLEAESRGHRAMALMCASVCWKGDPTDTEGLLSVADEFLQYIQGDNAVMPRPDKATKGHMPKPGNGYRP